MADQTPTEISESGLQEQLKRYLASVEGLSPSMTDYESAVAQSIAEQKLAAQQEYDAAKQLGLSELQAQYLADKTRMANEQAAMGRYGSGVGLQSLANVETAKAQGLSNLIAKLTAQKAARQYETAASAPQQLLAGKQFGLQSKTAQSSGYGDLSKTIGNILEGRSERAQNQRQFDVSQQLAREKAASEGRQSLEQRQDEKSAMGQFKNIGSTVGNLVSSIGSLFSDKRLKKNIQKIAEVNGINIYSFEYIVPELPKGVHFGVIAQEIEDKIPNAVSESNGYKMVDYGIVSEYLRR